MAENMVHFGIEKVEVEVENKSSFSTEMFDSEAEVKYYSMNSFAIDKAMTSMFHLSMFYPPKIYLGPVLLEEMASHTIYFMIDFS
jgi:hypothetical protein